MTSSKKGMNFKMRINPDKLLKKLDEKWKDIPCPFCGDHEWTVDPTIVTPLEVNSNKQMNLGGKFHPLVPVTCRCCGYTAFINALVLDCIEDGKES